MVYVDDMIIASNSFDEFEVIKQVLNDQFKIKDLGQMKYFLGIEVAYSKVRITICQRKYCLDLIYDECLLGVKPIKSLIDPSKKLHRDSSNLFEDIACHRRLVGKLLYLTTTRSNIAFVIHQLSRFLHTPSKVHYDTACKVTKVHYAPSKVYYDTACKVDLRYNFLKKM